uniref:Uncharacterized protein n=1 Tax=Rhizophora mucronata TaxID=61149 RepID=A0A2P2PVV9_RHIMU
MQIFLPKLLPLILFADCIWCSSSIYCFGLGQWGFPFETVLKLNLDGVYCCF